ncbi:nuclear pore protein-like protein [Colletotrichum truncatum]|uniref:Nuclear pore protein-like protein n=1 Tax=Colletotrichum truncatum TaxID=5467 RepID=A0ACC3YWL9_COLTU|nr:nuclear pore protein-like protein [Colletotrichum truncatum]KAF6787494.1 nuclear pore protein-like protein [Colletotrichum truncatum]
MAGLTELPLRPLAAPIDHNIDMDLESESEWIKTPSEDAFFDEGEVQIDPYGDLILRVGCDPRSGDSYSFRVCSNTLRRASPFWRRTLAETSNETQAADDGWYWTPSLFACPYEKSDGLAILLNIIHSKFHLVPKRPTVSEIYNALCLVSMYEMEQVLHPWIEPWYEVIEDLQSARDGHTLAMLACIAWGLGDEKLYTKTVTDITLTCTVDERGHITTADGVCLDDYLYGPLGSPMISDNIRSLRSQLASDMPSHINKLITRLIDGKWMCVGISDIPITKNKRCDYVVLGSLFAGMIYVRGSKATELEIRKDESIADLHKSVKQVLSHVSCYEKHSECNPAERIAMAMKDTIEELDTTLSASIVQRMREQRIKAGLEAKAFDEEKT